MIDFSALSVDGKEVKWLTVDGRIVYSTSVNRTPISYAFANEQLSVVGASSQTTYTVPGTSTAYTCDLYDTPAQNWLSPGTGYQNLFPITTHVYARAAHWGGTLQEAYVGNSSFSITVNAQDNATTWAKANGFGSAYVNSLNIADLQFVYSESNPISANVYTVDDLPYFIDEAAFKGIFHRDNLEGLVGWCGTKLSLSCQPIVFISEFNNASRWGAPFRYISLIPDEDYTSYIRQLSATYLAQDGDSGKPIFLTVDNGKNIIVSHNYLLNQTAFGQPPYIMNGPNYIKAYKVIKAYVESKGDTLKTIES